MQGGTHLAFGTATSLLAVGLAGIGLRSGVTWHHIVLAAGSTHPIAFTIPDLHPAAWLALILAGGLGSLLPDIDQPGSLVTRMPARQGRALQHMTMPYSQGMAGTPTRMAAGTVVAGGDLASALLGSTPGHGPRRALYLLLALICGILAAILRWLPPVRILTVPVQARHTAALCLGALGAGLLLLALGGVAGIINRLPGHHRGWTHAPPVATALTVAAFAFGPLLLPALPGVGPAFAVGYISHLAADALTIRGIPLFWPGRTQPSLHLLPGPVRVRTGSGGEAVFNVCWPVGLAIVAALVR